MIKDIVEVLIEEKKEKRADDVKILKIYPASHICNISVYFSVFLASILLAMNFHQIKRNKQAILVLAIGILMTVGNLMFYIFTVFLMYLALPWLGIFLYIMLGLIRGLEMHGVVSYMWTPVVSSNLEARDRSILKVIIIGVLISIIIHVFLFMIATMLRSRILF